MSIPSVYAITPEFEPDKEHFGFLIKVIPWLLQQGAMVQIRQKQWTPETMANFLENLLPHIEEKQKKYLLLNRRWDLALHFPHLGVHLPEAELSKCSENRLLPSPRLIGASCHTEANLSQAQKSGLDFATISPLFESPGKGPPLGVESLQKMNFPKNFPVFGLGGINASNIALLYKTKLYGFAAIRSLFDATTRQTMLEMKKIFSDIKSETEQEHHADPEPPYNSRI